MQANPRIGRLIFIVFAFCLVLAMPGATLAQTVLSTVTTSAAGVLDGAVTIPASTAPGVYDLTASGLAPVAASAYPPSSAASITLSSTTVTAGETLRVSGTGWSPSTPVTLRLQLVSLSEASFTLAQATEVRTASARLRVVAPAASGNNAAASGGSGKVLSRTGTTALPLLIAGLGTILLGTVLVIAGRRRHRTKTLTL